MKAIAAIEAEVSPVGTARMRMREAEAVRSRLVDYLELTKPRIAVMALFTVAAGYLLAAGSELNSRTLFNTLLGAGLVAAGGSALNQLFERRLDARMRRTANRPLPAGRISVEEVAIFGAVLSGVGLAYLLATVSPAATLAAAATLVCYALIYTPMKTITPWNTVIGAVPGALPPVIGWCAARGWSGFGGATALFLLLFVWQLPHFLAIAWMYRDDYARAGLRMLPGRDPTGKLTATAMMLTAAILIPVGFLAVAVGLAGWLFAIGATLLGAMFLRQAVGFAGNRTDGQAKRVLRASLVYLPGVFGLLLIDGLLVGCAQPAPPSITKTEPDLSYQVGPFSLTERSGKTVTDRDLRGSVWIASFVFTRCTGPCPAVSSTVARLQKELKDEPGVKFVTFTVDPDRDDLAALRAYANARQGDPERWLFLTGDKKTIHDLLVNQFKQGVEEHSGPDVKAGEEFDHSTRLVLVDRDGVIRSMFAGLPDDRYLDADAAFEAGLSRLKARARELLR